MFSEKRSELSIPVVGFLLLGLATLFAAIAIFNAKWDIFEIGVAGSDRAVYILFAVFLSVVAFFAFSKAYLVEGVAFGIFATFIYLLGVTTTFGLQNTGMLAVVLCVASIFLIFMSFRVGDVLLMFIAAFSFLALITAAFADTTDSAAFLVSGIALLAVAVIALIYAFFEWMFVQDIAMDYAEYMYGDDDDAGCCCSEE